MSHRPSQVARLFDHCKGCHSLILVIEEGAETASSERWRHAEGQDDGAEGSERVVERRRSVALLG